MYKVKGGLQVLIYLSLSDIEKWMDRDKDQHMLQLDLHIVNSTAQRFSSMKLPF